MINLYHFFCKNVLGMCTLMSQFCKHVSRYLLKSTTNNIAIWTNFQTVCLLLQFLLLLYFTRSSVINLINCKTLWLNLLVFYFKVASQVTTPVSSSIVSVMYVINVETITINIIIKGWNHTWSYFEGGGGGGVGWARSMPWPSLFQPALFINVFSDTKI